MPRLSSGKIDRKVLKSQPLAPAAPAEGGDEPETPAETALFAALEGAVPRPAAAPRAGLFQRPGRPLAAGRAPGLQAAAGRVLCPGHRGRHLHAPPPGRHRPGAAGRHGRCAGRRGRAPLPHPRPLAPLALRPGPGPSDSAAGAAEHGAVAGPLLCLPLLHRRCGGLDYPRRGHVGAGVFGQHAAGLWRGHHGALAAGRPPGTGQLPAVGPDLLPLVAGRSANRDRARVPAQRLGAVPGLAAPAGRAHRARGGAGFHHHARAAPGQHWRGHQHRQRRESGKCPRRGRPAAPGSHRHWRQRLHRLLRGHRRRHGGR